MQAQPLPAGRPRRAALFPSLTEAVRRDILAMVRALPDEELLELVGDQLADLVTRRGAAPLAREEKPAPTPAAPARRGRPRRRPSPTPEAAPTPEETTEDEDAAEDATPEAAVDGPAEDATPEARGALLPWPRSAEDGTPLGIDLAGRGPQGRPMAEEVRRLTLARWKGNVRRVLDPEELVQEVYCRILRRNRLACAWNPSLGSIGHYVHRIAGNAIADMLAAQRRRDAREVLGSDPARVVGEDEPDARDPIGAYELADAAVEAGVDLDATREAGMLGMLMTRPVRALWERALERRGAELSIDAEILEYIGTETEAGRPVYRAELAAMLGRSADKLRPSLARLEESGRIEAREGERRGRPVAYWARSAPAPELPPEVLTFSPGEPAAPEAPSAPALAEEHPVALEPLPLPADAEEPATAMSWPRRSLVQRVNIQALRRHRYRLAPWVAPKPLSARDPRARGVQRV